MKFHIITIFPEIFDSYLKESISGRAIRNKLIGVKFYNPRDFVRPARTSKMGGDKKDNGYRPVDDKPYGGGPGMVMRAEPIVKAVNKVLNKVKGKSRKVLIINFIPSAQKFTTTSAKNISTKEDFSKIEEIKLDIDEDER